MSAVAWHVVMSLDGFIAAPGDDMRWVFELVGPSDTADEMVATTGAIVMGRRTYEVEDRDRPGIYGGAWTGPFFVVTHEAPATVPDWMTGTFVHDGVEDAVHRAKTAAGERNVGILGAGVARQCLDAGLLDEIVVQVAPVLLGDGVRLFDRPRGHRIRLERTSIAESGQLTDLRLRVLK
jgi:dihydrofolate reductase